MDAVSFNSDKSSSSPVIDGQKNKKKQNYILDVASSIFTKSFEV